MSTRSGAPRIPLPPLLLVAALAAFGLAMLASTPPGSAPDEYAHYLKAAAAGRGALILDRDPPPLAPGQTGTREAWMDTQDRLVALPARLAPDPFLCWAQPYYVGTCPDRAAESSDLRDFSTYVGRYPPYGYVVPGLAMRPATQPIRALYLGRLAALAVALGLTAAAAIALYGRDGALALAGLAAALTPMAVYVLATLSSSSLEVASAICFAATLLRITRPGDPAPGWVWAAWGASGLLLAVVRDLGMVWVALISALIVGAAGVRRTIAIARSNRRRATFAGLAIAAGVGAAGLWQLTQGPASPPATVTLAGLRSAIALLPNLAHQAIGIFGALDTPVPLPGAVLSTFALGLVIGAALVGGSGRERLVLTLGLVALAGIALAAQVIQQQSGFGAQARHLLPYAVVIPLVAGEMVNRRRLPVRSSLAFLAVVAGASALAHLVAWHTIGRRYSVGLSGPAFFFDQAQWTPVLGWEVWGAIALMGALLMIGSAFTFRAERA